jgi:GntR family transcriptional regulator
MTRYGSVSKQDPLDLHEQVAAQLRRAIADGEAAPGERLAPAVDIAAILGVNKNTVIRALHTLRDEGLLDFTRGRGTRVVGTPQRSALLLRVDELVAFARRQGFRADELTELVATRAAAREGPQAGTAPA